MTDSLTFGNVTLLHGDCLEVMPTLGHVDAVVTDPPYEIKFMGRKWDATGVAFRAETWRLCFDLLKPGGHLLAFGGTRTHHRIWSAIEDAGLEIRDTLSWLYGSGLPKHRSQLKPAFEPICLARKPLSGTVAANVQQHGTGALNIEACRVACEPGDKGDWPLTLRAVERTAMAGPMNHVKTNHQVGRWPANVLHDGSDEVVAAFPETGPGDFPATRGVGGIGASGHRGQQDLPSHKTDAGSAARFFYSAKASADDRVGSAHPTIKPVALMRWLVRLVTPPGGVVLDPFAGTGTTAVAALREGVRAVCIERDPVYFQDAVRRLQMLSGADAPLFAERDDFDPEADSRANYGVAIDAKRRELDEGRKP